MILRRFSNVVAVLAILLFFTSATAQEHPVTATDGIVFLQLDFPENVPPVPNSAVGMFRVNLLSLRVNSGIASGYLNVVIADDWAVRNMIVPLEQDFPYSHLSTTLDLGVAEGADLSTLEALVLFSSEVAETVPVGTASTYPVGAESMVQDGLGGENGQRGAGPASPPDLSTVLFADPTNNRSLFQLDHPNLEAAQNQCYPMAVANSLQFLANTTDLELPHSHVPGLRGDSSLVGQLDAAMDRIVISRRSGQAVHDVPGIDGKLKYLVDNDLQDRVQTRHWGKFSGDGSRVHIVGAKRATSAAGGLSLPFDELLNSLERGENCEAGYSYPGGGHAIDIAAAGYINGQPWIIDSSDINQSSDYAGAGAQGFQFSLLKDTNSDGYMNLNGSTKELDLLICQRYVPPPELPLTFLPPPTGLFMINDASITIDLTIDPDNHSCCVDSPPPGFDLLLQDGMFLISGNASWLPFNAMLDGDEFFGTNSGTVAGFPNVDSSVAGVILENGLDLVISVGIGGEFPGGQPIIWELSVGAEEEEWPPIAGADRGLALDRSPAGARKHRDQAQVARQWFPQPCRSGSRRTTVG
jgi:hypothetical protein